MVKRTRRLGFVVLLLALLLALTSSVAFAQGGGPDKVVMGGSYELRSGETLGGGLLVLGGSAVLQPDSNVNGDMTVLGGSVDAGGTIHGDVSVLGGSVTLRSTAIVDGSVNTVGGSVKREPGARVSGQSGGPSLFGPLSPPVQPPAPPVQQLPPRPGPFGALLGIIGHFFRALGLGLLMAIIGIVVVLLAPVSTGRVATAFGTQPAVNFAVGLLTLVLATLIGFPLLLACGLGALVWLLTFVALVFGWIAAGLWLGQRLLHQTMPRATSSSLGEVALGVFLLTWVTWVLPVCLRWPLGIIIGSLGLGAVVMSRFGTWTGSGSWPFGTAQPAPARGPAPASGGPAPASNLLPAEATAVATGSAAGVAAADPDRSVWARPPASGAPEVVAESLATAPTVPPLEEPSAMVAEEPLRPVPPTEQGQSGVAQSSRAGSLEDLEAVQGVTPEIGQRLRASGNTTLVALATSDPDSLARATGVDADRIRAEDWIGQARRLLG